MADSISDFQSHKKLTLIAGFPPGGGCNTYVRVLARRNDLLQGAADRRPLTG